MKKLCFSFLLVLLVGCASAEVDKSTESYRQADEKYREGHVNRLGLVKGRAAILEAYDRDVASLWEEGLKINGYHRLMRKDLVRLYLQLGEQYDDRAEGYMNGLEKVLDTQQREANLRRANADGERAKHYLELALKHIKFLSRVGANPTELNLFQGRVYMALNQYNRAIIHLKAALESGDLDPEKQKNVKLAILKITRLSAKRE